MKNFLFTLLLPCLVALACAKKAAPVASSPAPAKSESNTGNTTVQAKEILGRYIAAIGGQAKLKQIRSVMMKMSASTGMGDITITRYLKDGKSAVKTEMGGNVLMEEKFDGQALERSGMGGTQKVTDTKSIAGAKKDARLFDELDNLIDDQAVKQVLGMEELNGAKAYKVKIVDANKNESTQYFDATTHLLIRTVSAVDGMGQDASQTMDFSDYRDVDGVKFPHVIKMTGGSIPFPLEMKITVMMINSDLPDQLFKIN
jgi:zinc protease